MANVRINKFISYSDKSGLNLLNILIESVKRTYDNDYEFLVGVTKDAWKSAKKILKNNHNVKLQIVPKKFLKNFNSESLFSNLTITSYARLFTFEIFHQFLNFNESYLYLDIDVVVNKVIYFPECNENMAVSNFFGKIDDNNSPLNFWINFFNKRINGVKTQNERDIFKNVLNSVENKMSNKTYFNSGVILINDFFKFKSLTKKVLSSTEYLNLIDDQNLLNHFNEGEIKVINEKRLNFKLTHDNDFNDDIMILHFNGKNKDKMKILFDNDFSLKNSVKEWNENI